MDREMKVLLFVIGLFVMNSFGEQVIYEPTGNEFGLVGRLTVSFDELEGRTDGDLPFLDIKIRKEFKEEADTLIRDYYDALYYTMQYGHSTGILERIKYNCWKINYLDSLKEIRKIIQKNVHDVDSLNLVFKRYCDSIVSINRMLVVLKFPKFSKEKRKFQKECDIFYRKKANLTVLKLQYRSILSFSDFLAVSISDWFKIREDKIRQNINCSDRYSSSYPLPDSTLQRWESENLLRQKALDFFYELQKNCVEK